MIDFIRVFDGVFPKNTQGTIEGAIILSEHRQWHFFPVITIVFPHIPHQTALFSFSSIRLNSSTKAPLLRNSFPSIFISVRSVFNTPFFGSIPIRLPCFFFSFFFPRGGVAAGPSRPMTEKLEVHELTLKMTLSVAPSNHVFFPILFNIIWFSIIFVN